MASFMNIVVQNYLYMTVFKRLYVRQLGMSQSCIDEHLFEFKPNTSITIQGCTATERATNDMRNIVCRKKLYVNSRKVEQESRIHAGKLVDVVVKLQKFCNRVGFERMGSLLRNILDNDIIFKAMKLNFGK